MIGSVLLHRAGAKVGLLTQVCIRMKLVTYRSCMHQVQGDLLLHISVQSPGLGRWDIHTRSKYSTVFMYACAHTCQFNSIQYCCSAQIYVGAKRNEKEDNIEWLYCMYWWSVSGPNSQTQSYIANNDQFIIKEEKLQDEVYENNCCKGINSEMYKDF